MKIYLKIIVFIFFTSLFLGCAERITYSGKIYNLSENINVHHITSIKKIVASLSFLDSRIL